MKALLLSLLCSCATIDTLDGHIDDQGNCCAALTVERIQECMIELAPPDTEGWCWRAECKPTGEVSAILNEDGSITSCPEE